jgi:hypothetical protein
VSVRVVEVGGREALDVFVVVGVGVDVELRGGGRSLVTDTDQQARELGGPP